MKNPFISLQVWTSGKKALHRPTTYRLELQSQGKRVIPPADYAMLVAFQQVVIHFTVH
jgi:hypothetical protein